MHFLHKMHLASLKHIRNRCVKLYTIFIRCSWLLWNIFSECCNFSSYFQQEETGNMNIFIYEGVLTVSMRHACAKICKCFECMKKMPKNVKTWSSFQHFFNKVPSYIISCEGTDSVNKRVKRLFTECCISDCSFEL